MYSDIIITNNLLLVHHSTQTITSAVIDTPYIIQSHIKAFPAFIFNSLILNTVIPAQPETDSRSVKIPPQHRYPLFVSSSSSPTSLALTPSFIILKLHGVNCPSAISTTSHSPRH